MVCVLQVPCILGVDLTAADLEEFIHQVKRSPVRCLNLIDLQVCHLLLHTLGVVNEYFTEISAKHSSLLIPMVPLPLHQLL